MAAARRRAAAALLLLGLLLPTVFAPTPAAAEVTPVFTIKDKRIAESSGLATDTGRGLYWTVNDSGGGAVAYGLADDGSVQGTLSFRADVRDVEAVAVHDNHLYVADIGDNNASRNFVTVYVFNDPTPDNRTVSYQSYDFRYPDGPRDAETLLINSAGRLFLVSKEGKGGIYAAPAQPSRQGVNQLQRVGDAPAYVTDGVVLPSDGRLALRTYVSLEVMDAGSYDVTARAALPFQPQGESITTTLDGRALLVGSEGTSSAVYRIPIPTKVAAVPSGSASPPRSAAPTTAPADPGTTPPASGSDTEGRSRRGTLLALGLAAALAVIAGVIVFAAPSRRRR
ncbi:hypothetical protein GCM10009841_35250 [Microlunatus panaciterrae]|uniref:Esterase-like activity of phytase family protein n=1 Tax=Microlunatus panaciterrae TaxID=400768 RepID=A0ABS2RJ00_9ACTN|nr:hypothetical protein [Microlunatus panaciterrae]MBM7798181.1 hypothetical protein [Microlunatus panaciterrae]